MADVQNYANHKKYVFGYHRVAVVLVTVQIVMAIKALVAAPSAETAVGLAAGVALFLVAFYARSFALQVQNRVIRLEERLRMATLLPDDLKGRVGEIRMGSYVALRFASDAELPGLVRRVLNGELATSDSIKRAIKDWRPDHDRA